MRVHLFEFEDLSWFPNSIREGGTDYLRYLLKATRYYEPIVPLIADALNKIGEKRIIDLCSGGGGSIEQIYGKLNSIYPDYFRIILSDKFPNVETYSLLSKRTGGKISYIDSSVDATAVHTDTRGFRTMFSAIHHFKPEQVRSILKNAIQSNSAIGLFDGGDKNVFTVLAIFLFHPVGFLLCTPFFKPFKLSRILFTYIIPLIPLMTIWDGCVSILRLYHPKELLALAKEVDEEKYTWLHGKTRNKVGMHVSYLIGYPKQIQ